MNALKASAEQEALAHPGENPLGVCWMCRNSGVTFISVLAPDLPPKFCLRLQWGL